MQNHNNSCVLNIYSLAGLNCVINLINGKCKTPKYVALSLITNWLNTKQCAKLTCLGLTTLPLGSNAWLAGFIDTDGSFNIDLRLQPRLKLSCQFQLNVIMTYPKTGQS